MDKYVAWGFVLIFAMLAGASVLLNIALFASNEELRTRCPRPKDALEFVIADAEHSCWRFRVAGSDRGKKEAHKKRTNI